MKNIKVKDCKRCPLDKARTHIVNGDGNINADFMLIGEAPGKEEDIAGKPFVGASGSLIDLALKKININRNDIYISNIVRCRPPGNRDPKDTEINACISYLIYEILQISPKVVCLLGRIPSKVFIPSLKSITKEEGKIYKIFNGIRAVPICHPSYYLRNYAPKERFFSNIVKAYNIIT